MTKHPKLSKDATKLLKILREDHEGDLHRDKDGAWFLVSTLPARESGIDRRSLGGLYSKLRQEGLYRSLDIQGNWGEVRATPAMLAEYERERS